MPASSARQAFTRPMRRQAPRVLRAQNALSVVDPLMGEAHDLPTATDRLWNALTNGDAEALRQALRFSPDLNARYRNTDQDEVLHEQQLDPERDDVYDPPPAPLPLEHCLKHNRLDLAEMLLLAGANPDGQAGFQPLLRQAIRHSYEALDLWVRYGAMVNPTDPKVLNADTTPAGEAVKTGHLDRVQRLLDAGAWLNLPEPLPASCVGPGAHHAWVTPLGVALKRQEPSGTDALIQHLLDAGASVARVSSDGTNALHHLFARDPSWVDRLVALGADPKGRDVYGATPLHAMIPALRSPADHQPHEANYRRRMASLVQHGANLNALDQAGRTPLLNALRGYAPLSVVRWMLDRGANPDLVQPEAFSPSARQHLLNSLTNENEEHPHYIEHALEVLVAAEQQALRATIETHAVIESSPRPTTRRRL